MITTVKCQICGKELKIESSGIKKGDNIICKNHPVKDLIKHMMEEEK